MKLNLRNVIPAFNLLLLFTLSGHTGTGQSVNGKLTIGPDAKLTIHSNGNLVANCDIDNQGTLFNYGRLVLNGSDAQTFPGGSGSVAAMNILEIRNSGTGVNLNQAITINKELKLTSGNLALGDYDITMESNLDHTAAISAMSSNAGVTYSAGRFVIERFINVGSSGHGKGWQLLSVPAQGLSIRSCWMENGAFTPGYGTQLSNMAGIGGGYDQYSFASSIKTYISETGGFDNGPANTAALINNPKGYFLFVRGDRTVSSGSGFSPTTLRVRGTIHTPATPPPPVVVAANRYESIGNPYASQVDFTQLSIGGGLDNSFYTWDPNITGTYNAGAYQTMSATNGWIPVPGGGAYNGVHTTIESGQAFMVHATNTEGSIAFSESAKTGESILVTRGNTAASGSSNRQFMRASLLTNTGELADGNAAAFDIDLENIVDGNDALKTINAGENFGLSRSQQRLAVEGRKPITDADTLFYYMSRLRAQPYRLLFVPENMSSSKQAWLVDRYTQIQHPVSLTDSSMISFSVTQDPLSGDSNRFMLVFKQLNVLPLSVSTINASRLSDHSIHVQWQITGARDLSSCLVERSGDGLHFTNIGTSLLPATGNATVNGHFHDANPLPAYNYYRIRARALDGTLYYSDVAAVAPAKNQPYISVYPNPVVGRQVQVYFAEGGAGSYDTKLTNSAGQVLHRSVIAQHTNAPYGTQLTIPATVPAGNYELSFAGNNGVRESVSIIIL